jgi:heat shock protein HtpX
MKRRGTGRDLRLEARMAFVVAALLSVYALLGFALFEVQKAQPGWALYVDIVALALVLAMVAQYKSASELLLRRVGATFVPPSDHSYGHVERLAALAGISPPRLASVNSSEANAFAVGTRRHDAVIVTTHALRERLSAKELSAVLAHEISHIANGDTSLMTAVTVPRTIGLLLVTGGESGAGYFLWLFMWPLGLPLFAIGSLLSLTMSRYREFAADRGSALLTGEPGQLMSALTKLADAPIPHRDLRQLDPVEALCIVPTRDRRYELFMDHPPLDKRLAHLSTIAQEMGKPVGS